MELDYNSVKVVLLDIEGTVCPISFVKDVLFPYALEALPSTLDNEWDSPAFAPYRSAFPPEHSSTPAAFSAHVHALTASDTKAPYLKALQGHLWTTGYTSGTLTCPLFADVAPALRAWTSPSTSPSPSPPPSAPSLPSPFPPPPPLTLIIYSSGSIAAQKLLFAHTNAGDLTPLLADYFDTTTAGPKTVRASYEAIMAKYEARWRPHEWLFLSDSAMEVRAALQAGMQACVVRRPGNVPLSADDVEELEVVDGFEEVGVRAGEGERKRR